MRLQDSIARGREVRQGSRGPKNRRTWQRIPPPENPVAEPLRPQPLQSSPPQSAPPVPGAALAATGTIPRRPLPPIAVGTDALSQFDNSGNVPRRRVFGPGPL